MKRLSVCLPLGTARAVGQSSQQTSTSFIMGGHRALPRVVVQSVELSSALRAEVEGTCQVVEELLLVSWISEETVRSLL